VTDLADWTASELVAAYARRAVSPVEVTRSVLDRVGEHDPTLNAFSLVDEEGALDQAARSEDRWRTGTPAGPVDGVPASDEASVRLGTAAATSARSASRASRGVDIDM